MSAVFPNMAAPVFPQYPDTVASGTRRPWLVFALTLFCLTILIGEIGVLAYQSLRDDIRAETYRTLTVIAEQKRQQIEGLLTQNRMDAELYFTGQAQLPVLLRQWLDGGRQDRGLLELMRAHLAEVARVRGWGGLAVFDTADHPLITIGDVDIAEHRPLLHETLRDHEVRAIDLHLDARGVAEYGLLVPIGSSGAPPLGVAFLTWRADQGLYPLVESWPVPTLTAETFLARPNGDGLRVLSPLRHHPNAMLALTQPLTSFVLTAHQAAQGVRGILEEVRDYRAAPVLAYVSTITGSPWLMIAKIDQREAEAGIRTIGWVTALVTCLVLLLLYASGYGLWRRLEQLADRAELQAQRAAEALLRETLEALRESEARYARAIRGTSDGIWDWNLQTGVDYHSPRYLELLGYSDADLHASHDSFKGIVHPDDLPLVEAAQQAHLECREPYDIELRLRMKDGAYRWFHLRGQAEWNHEGRAVNMAGSITDITERKQAEEALLIAKEQAETANRALQAVNVELNRLATTDPLTGARNRRYFEQAAEVQIAQSNRYGSLVSLVLFDVDHFKSINDRHGHQTGDQVLVELARLVHVNLRSVDVLARWGGEEFAVMMPLCGLTEALNLAEKLRALLAARSFPVVGSVTASFGVAEHGTQETLDDWLKRVDDALYAAKAAGRNRVCQSPGTEEEQ